MAIKAGCEDVLHVKQEFPKKLAVVVSHATELPQAINQSTLVDGFKRTLKTYLFRESFISA